MARMPNEHASEMLGFLIQKLAMARTWHALSDRDYIGPLIHSSQVLQENLNYFIEDSSRDREPIARLIWKKANSWTKYGSFDCTIEDYDEILDLAFVKASRPSVLHACVINKRFNILRLLKMGASPHLISLADVSFHEPFDTPTSLAMYTSDSFYYWKEEVKSAEVDLGDFVDQEIEVEPDMNGRKMPLLHSGWTRAPLLELFRSEFIPSTCERQCECGWVDETGTVTKLELQEVQALKQPKWLQFLGAIKHKNQSNQSSATTHDFDLHKVSEDPSERSSMEIEDSTQEISSKFCFPGHKGCYLCHRCWSLSEYRSRDF